ncbi:hypothetical protein H4R20_001348 [Coemansia guatemalensis]|uniref:F-box domain-containing protein n=1 Tax=Coemansia guatemalensis TaxID=2761395 RepID=A0A9W8HZC2_9FUNG|nr:hypothetical protein H4R20_001348 [Coemansia guatemalensis]
MYAKDLITRLPFDLVVMIAGRLSVDELYRCWLVSRGWYELFTSDSILYPVFMQKSHFDQESFMFQCLPGASGHGHNDSDNSDDGKESGDMASSTDKHSPDIGNKTAADKTANAKGDESGESDAEDPQKIAEELKRLKVEEEMRLEERVSQHWLKDKRVLMRVLQNLLNRGKRWSRAEPSTRIYLPPVPVDGTDSDIREEWQGAVQTVKMKAGIVAVLYSAGKSIRLWNLISGYEEIKEMTNSYIEKNREVLLAQTKYGGPQLPPFTEEQVANLLKCSRSGVPRKAVLSVLPLRVKPKFFDFFCSNKLLATATLNGEVDVYDMKTCKHLRTFKISGSESIESIHVWLEYVVVSHGTRITLWNHTTGEVLEDGLETAHRVGITGVFILDNDRHLLSIDKKGILVVTNRDAESPRSDTLLDVPLYPVILAGDMGAPYSMRLLHMTHLCVWGRYSLGHYELYEPGLRSLPPLGSLIVTPSGEIQRDPDTESQPGVIRGPFADADEAEITFAQPPPPEVAGAAAAAAAAVTEETGANALQSDGDVNRQVSDAQSALAQLEASHENLEIMYSQMVGDRTDAHPEGERMEHFRRNRVPAEERYHVINIDTSFEHVEEGQVLSVDFRHALFQNSNYLHICDLENRADSVNELGGISLGLLPIDPLPEPLEPRTPAAGNVPDDLDSGSEFDYDSDSSPAEDDTTPANIEAKYFFDWAVDEEFAALEGDDDSEAGAESIDDIDQYNDYVLAQRETRDERRSEMRRLLQRPGPNIEKADLIQLEALTMRYILGLRFLIEDPGFGRIPFNKMQLRNAREFISKYMPELSEAINDGASVDSMIYAAPYYVQRAYESRFKKPVLVVDHRGQIVSGRKICNDMERIHRVVSPKAGSGLYQQMQRGHRSVVPEAACRLRCESAAMDDGQIAIGCQNGYVVITTFD